VRKHKEKRVVWGIGGAEERKNERGSETRSRVWGPNAGEAFGGGGCEELKIPQSTKSYPREGHTVKGCPEEREGPRGVLRIRGKKKLKTGLALG